MALIGRSVSPNAMSQVSPFGGRVGARSSSGQLYNPLPQQVTNPQLAPELMVMLKGILGGKGGNTTPMIPSTDEYGFRNMSPDIDVDGIDPFAASNTGIWDVIKKLFG